MLFSTAKGRKIVSTGTAETVGHVDHPVVDPATHSVVALGVKKHKDGDTLLWSDLTAFGDDAVTVPGAEVVRVAEGHVAELSGKHATVIGKRVLTSGGDDLGTVGDLDVDQTSGVVVSLVLTSGDIAGERLMGVGSYAVVVRDEAGAGLTATAAPAAVALDKPREAEPQAV